MTRYRATIQFEFLSENTDINAIAKSLQHEVQTRICEDDQEKESVFVRIDYA